MIQKLFATSIMGFSIVFVGATEASARKNVSVFTYSGGTKYVIEPGLSTKKKKTCYVKFRKVKKKQTRQCVKLFTGNASYMFIYKKNGVYKVSQGYPSECGTKLTYIPGRNVPQVKIDPCSGVTSLSDAAKRALNK